MRVLVLLNEKSGTLAASTTGDEPERIRRGFETVGVQADVRAVKGADLAAAARGAGEAGYDAVVAGGGDGTINTIAAALAGGLVPFGVLPLGTHNHFAKDVGVPLDLDAAVAALGAALVAGDVQDLDVAEVNGRLFLNFSGIGLHPAMVKERDAQQKAIGGTKVVGVVLRKAVKLLAGAMAFAAQLRDLPLLRVWITARGRTTHRVTPSVIICNNPHQMQVFGVEQVSCVTRSVLNAYVAKSRGPVGLVRLLLAALFRRLDTTNAREFETVCASTLRIGLHRRKLPVSIDGEVVRLDPPLRYRIRPGGLRVIAPRPPGPGTAEMAAGDAADAPDAAVPEVAAPAASGVA